MASLATPCFRRFPRGSLLVSARWYQVSASLRAGERGGRDSGPPKREGRPFPDPKASRRIDALREDPMHKKWGGFIDILEHDAYCNKVREANPDGFLFDHTVAPGESDCEEDPFANGYLTEDEIMFPEGYTPRDYLPNAVKQRIFYLYTKKGWDMKRLADKFGLRTERVSAIINLKATEHEMVATGRYREEVDTLLTQLYGGKSKWQEPQPSTDVGIDVMMVQDDAAAPDVAPKIPSQLRGKILRTPKFLEKIPQPDVKDRVFRSKYVFKDISGNPCKKTQSTVVDYSGARRPATSVEESYRTWTPKYTSVKRGAVAGKDMQ